jgi:luciferase family oxidoreductase group 1
MMLSILDLAPIPLGSDASQALRNSLDLAQHAERWGYTRYWVAEHHNMPGIASAATSVVIAHLAGGTKTIRVGSGGIMLPNHAPLVIAEQFGTLESLFPGRIDLGLGRAPGTDMLTARALRRDLTDESADNFPRDVVELQAYFEPTQPGQRIRAVPGAGLRVPIWLLGSSLFSAQLAAMLGLPFAFASHFAPDYLMHAAALYRQEFKPSAQLDKPYFMMGCGAFVADTDAEARHLFTSVQQSMVNLRLGKPARLPPPVEMSEELAANLERTGAARALAYAAVGSPATVKRRLQEFIAALRPDEIMATAMIYDHAARLRSFELLAGVGRELGAAEAASAAEVK